METSRRAAPALGRPDDGVDEPLQRLNARFRASVSDPRLLPADAAGEVLRAFNQDEQWRKLLGTPEPNSQDVLDALAQGDVVRSGIDNQELHLIARARQLGEPWQRIGVALGYAEVSAAKLAKARYDRLREMFPNSTYPSTNGAPQ